MSVNNIAETDLQMGNQISKLPQDDKKEHLETYFTCMIIFLFLIKLFY